MHLSTHHTRTVCNLSALGDLLRVSAVVNAQSNGASRGPIGVDVDRRSPFPVRFVSHACPLMWAAAYGRVNVVNFLLRAPRYSTPHSCQSAMFVAIVCNRVSVVKALVACTAYSLNMYRVFESSGHPDTALGLASQSGNAALVAALLSGPSSRVGGAIDLEARTQASCLTPLETAVFAAKDLATVQMLVAGGAKITCSTSAWINRKLYSIMLDAYAPDHIQAWLLAVEQLYPCRTARAVGVSASLAMRVLLEQHIQAGMQAKRTAAVLSGLANHVRFTPTMRTKADRIAWHVLLGRVPYVFRLYPPPAKRAVSTLIACIACPRRTASATDMPVELAEMIASYVLVTWF